jgi:hypothetical protein
MGVGQRTTIRRKRDARLRLPPLVDHVSKRNIVKRLKHMAKDWMFACLVVLVVCAVVVVVIIFMAMFAMFIPGSSGFRS